MCAFYILVLQWETNLHEDKCAVTMGKAKQTEKLITHCSVLTCFTHCLICLTLVWRDQDKSSARSCEEQRSLMVTPCWRDQCCSMRHSFNTNMCMWWLGILSSLLLLQNSSLLITKTACDSWAFSLIGYSVAVNQTLDDCKSCFTNEQVFFKIYEQ